jgi:hypothetical protein
MARGTGRAWELFNVGAWQTAGGRPQTVACRWLGLGRQGREGEGAAWTAMIDLAQAGASWTVGGRAGRGRGLIGRDRERTTLSGGKDTSTAWSRRRSGAGGQGGDEIGAGLGHRRGRGGRLGRVVCLATSYVLPARAGAGGGEGWAGCSPGQTPGCWPARMARAEIGPNAAR